MMILALEMASTGKWHCASLYQCTFVPYISRQTAEDIKASVQLIVNMLMRTEELMLHFLVITATTTTTTPV